MNVGDVVRHTYERLYCAVTRVDDEGVWGVWIRPDGEWYSGIGVAQFAPKKNCRVVSKPCPMGNEPSLKGVPPVVRARLKEASQWTEK